MDPWLQLPEFSVSLADVSQFLVLVAAAPTSWQTILAIALLPLLSVSLLLTIYRQFLAVRLYQKPDDDRQTTSEKPNPNGETPRAPSRRRQKHFRRRRSVRGIRHH